MRVLEIQGSYGLDNLKIAERPDPTPGPGQVAVSMRAVSLNFRDLMTVIGIYGGNFPLPLVPFSDGCGVISAIGPGVTRVKVGDRVSSLFFQNWFAGPPKLEKIITPLGGPLDGCGQEVMIVSEQGVSKVPEFLTDNQVSTLACAGLTAWRALVVDGDVKAGDIAVLQGTGGVSIFALQFAKAMGLEVIITSSSDEKLERAKAMGADHVINYKATPSWSSEVRKITNGRGADIVVEVGGAQTLPQSISSVRIGGHVAIIGVLSGVAEPFNVASLIQTSARVQGLSVGSREMFEDMCRAMELHKIAPVVGQTFPWTEAKAALESMRDGQHFGKICLEF